MSIRVENRVNSISVDLAGRSVGEIREMLRQALNISPRAAVYVNGKEADSKHIVRDGDNLEFIKVSGVKGLYGGSAATREPRVIDEEYAGGTKRPHAAIFAAGHGVPRILSEARVQAPRDPGVASARNKPREVDEYAVDREKISRAPLHPGVFLERNILPEFLRQRRAIGEVARLLGVSRQTLHRLMAGRTSVTPDMAVRLGKLCGNGPGLWLSLQARYDIWEATQRLGQELKNIPTLRD